MIVPVGLLRKLQGQASRRPADLRPGHRATPSSWPWRPSWKPSDSLGYVPRDVSDQNLGYDIESSIPGTGLLRFIEVKGRVKGAKTVTITKNEILTGLNKPDDSSWPSCVIDGDTSTSGTFAEPFEREPDFKATSVNYDLTGLLAQAQEPA